MLTIRNDQLDVFKETALKRFEDEMVEHVKTFFPAHYISMQEKNLRATVQYGYAKAKTYGVISIRNVCLYLNNMLLLGSNFDEDPQYPWAKQILAEKNEPDFNRTMDELSGKMMVQLGEITGQGNMIIYRAILNFTKNSNEIFTRLTASDLSKALHHLNLLFKQKYEVVGEANLKEMIACGIPSAKKYGITDEGYLVVYIVFMFMLGSGFDRDPQFPWAAVILQDVALDQQQKTAILYKTAIANLDKVLSQNSN